MNLERAIQIAVEAHKGQLKANKPYILHPLRVMFLVAGDDEQIVAVLHDVVEHSPDWTFDRLQQEGFPPAIIRALESVSKRPEEEDDYMAFIKRAGQNEIGRKVKIADLIDNLDMFRMPRPSQGDYERIEKYEMALSYLEGIDDERLPS